MKTHIPFNPQALVDKVNAIPEHVNNIATMLMHVADCICDVDDVEAAFKCILDHPQLGVLIKPYVAARVAARIACDSLLEHIMEETR
jgi:hypothetical protein